MRILVLGAGGFIGRHLLADLIGQGHEIVAIARSATALSNAFAGISVVAMDLAKAIRPGDWTPMLKGVDIVVNAAGVLRGSDMWPVHVDMPRALYAAAQAESVKRIILVSAISARPDVGTDYARAKLAGEAALRDADLGWTILRPSLVYGDGSYGGTSLMRGMAGLPWIIPVPGTGDFLFTPIHVLDLARTIRVVCEEVRFDREVLEPAGPETLKLTDMLARYRAWLGFGAARVLNVPLPVMRIIGRIGDLAGDGPIATNSLVQMIAGNAGNSTAFAEAIGFKPRTLDVALGERPAQVQDRWHARLFFLAPAITATLALMWIVSAVLGFVTGSARTNELVAALGWPAALANPLRIGSSLLDLLVATLIVLDGTGRRSTPAQVIVVVGYSLVIGVALPGLARSPDTAFQEFADTDDHPRARRHCGQEMIADPYLLIKWIHVLSSTILFGFGAGTAWYFWNAHLTRDPRTIAEVGRMVVRADWIFTGASGVVQPLSGVALAYHAGWSLAEPWLVVSYCLYALAFTCWAPVVWLQIKAQRLAQFAAKTGAPLGIEYRRTMRLWFLLGWPAFLGLLGVFWLMIAKPQLW